MQQVQQDIQPIDQAEHPNVTCWIQHCTTPATWTVLLAGAVFGTKGMLMALCDVHLYEFETQVAA